MMVKAFLGLVFSSFPFLALSDGHISIVLSDPQVNCEEGNIHLNVAYTGNDVIDQDVVIRVDVFSDPAKDGYWVGFADVEPAQQDEEGSVDAWVTIVDGSLFDYDMLYPSAYFKPLGEPSSGPFGGELGGNFGGDPFPVSCVDPSVCPNPEFCCPDSELDIMMEPSVICYNGTAVTVNVTVDYNLDGCPHDVLIQVDLLTDTEPQEYLTGNRIGEDGSIPELAGGGGSGVEAVEIDVEYMDLPDQVCLDAYFRTREDTTYVPGHELNGRHFQGPCFSLSDCDVDEDEDRNLLAAAWDGDVMDSLLNDFFGNRHE
ncbi:unnamed protein product [Chrysoparadoxa australica]